MRRLASSFARILLALCCAALPGHAAVHATTFEEHAIKAALLVKFAFFVTWPQDSLPPRAITVGLPDDSPSTPAIEVALRGRLVNGVPVVVRRIRGTVDVDSCRIVYIPDADPVAALRTLRLVGGRPVLTVGEEVGFLERGGMIRLRVVRQRLRFDISHRMAERAGLRIGSSLLRVAEHVVD